MSDYPLNNNFVAHAPTPEQSIDLASIRDAAYELAHDILHVVPDSRERSIALTKVEEAMFWANAGIARTSPPADI